jgi:hypothetical protein
VYAGGDFTVIGGQPREQLAAIDALTGLATTWNAGLAGRVGGPGTWEVVVAGPKVFVAGGFTSVGGLAHPGFAGILTVTRTTATAADRPPALRRELPRFEVVSGSLGSATSLRFVLPSAAPVQVSVFDVAGRRVEDLLEERWLVAGEHQVDFRSAGLASGVYWCRLQAGADVVTRKLVVRR